MMEGDIFEIAKSLVPLLDSGIKVMIGIGIIALVLNSLYRRRLKVPTGLGFKSIRIKPVSSKVAFESLDFKYLVRGTLIIGGAGSGKTKSLIDPLVENAIKNRYAGIIYDYKFPGLANIAYQHYLLCEQTTRLVFVNFTDVTKSHRFNVFSQVSGSAEAREYASALIMNLLPETIRHQDFFVRSAITYLTSTIVYFYNQQRDFCTLPHVISFLLRPETLAIVELLKRDGEAGDLISSIESGLSSERQTAGVISTLQNALSICSSPEIYWVLSGQDFDLDINNPDDPKLLVIGNEASLTSALSPVISLTITASLRKMNSKGKAKSILLMDEAPTLFIPNLDMIPATGRENQIATVYCAQDISQMEDKYGEKKAEALIGNLANQFYGKISNPRTAEKVVRLFDKDEIEFESRSSNISSGLSKYSSGSSRTLQQRDRVAGTHLRDLNPGEFLATTVLNKDFKVRFKLLHTPEEHLPEITYVNNQLIQANYHKIKDDVKKIIASSTFFQQSSRQG